DSLFGSASADAGLDPQPLAEAADALRRGLAGPGMSGLAVTGYSTFAQSQASSLARLAQSDTEFNQIIRTSAAAQNTAAAASRSTVAAAAERADNLPTAVRSVGAQRAMIAALHSEIARQQELVRRHQQQAAALTEQLLLLSYY